MEYAAKAWLDSDGIWTIEVPDLFSVNERGEKVAATGLAPSWSRVELAAKEVVAVWTDQEVEDIDVSIEVVTPREVRAQWEESVMLEKQGRDALAQAAASRRQAVMKARNLGLPTEAIGKAFGVSQQRVSKLINS